MTPRRPQKEPVNHVLVKRQFNFTAKALVDRALHKAPSTISYGRPTLQQRLRHHPCLPIKRDN